MTIILGFSAGDYVEHASDRTTSIQTTSTAGHVWDPAANKTIIVLARDGYAVLGYTGLAYLRGRPSDEVIAVSLFGWNEQEPIPDAALIGRFRRAGPTLDDLFHALRQDLSRILARSPSRIPFEILAFGWSRRDRHWQRSMWLFGKRGGDPFHIVRSDATPLIASAPTQQFMRQDAEALGAALSARQHPSETPDVLAGEIRRWATIRPDAIGPDVMTVVMKRPDLPDPRVMVRYIPDPARAPLPANEYGAFSPWVVGPGVFAPPFQLAAGMMQLIVGGITIDFEGSRGGITSSSIQCRKPPPR